MTNRRSEFEFIDNFRAKLLELKQHFYTIESEDVVSSVLARLK
jgi:hypothetical protein